MNKKDMRKKAMTEAKELKDFSGPGVQIIALKTQGAEAAVAAAENLKKVFAAEWGANKWQAAEGKLGELGRF
eukprot:12850709-Alexandrium_andersonii.AAC.1